MGAAAVWDASGRSVGPLSPLCSAAKPRGKWYGVMMDVPRDKLGLAGTGNAEVLNVKCAPLLVGSLWLQAGFLPAYHMNKSSWVSILLNGTVSNEEIKNLIDMSYTLVQAKRRRKSRDCED